MSCLRFGKSNLPTGLRVPIKTLIYIITYYLRFSSCKSFFYQAAQGKDFGRFPMSPAPNNSSNCFHPRMRAGNQWCSVSYGKSTNQDFPVLSPLLQAYPKRMSSSAKSVMKQPLSPSLPEETPFLLSALCPPIWKKSKSVAEMK